MVVYAGKKSSNCDLFLLNLTLSDDCLLSLGTNQVLDRDENTRSYETGDTYCRDSFRVFLGLCIYMYSTNGLGSPPPGGAQQSHEAIML